MCESIRLFKEPFDIQTVRQFQDYFSVDAKVYGWEGDIESIDCCMCDIDLDNFFKQRPDLKFYYDSGEWWEGEKELN